MTKVKLVGKVLKKEADILTVETLAVGRDGVEYRDQYDIHATGKSPKVGTNVAVIGVTAYDQEDGTVWIEATKPITETDEPSTNLAKAEGEAVGVFQFFERNDDKKSFGNGLIKTEDGWQRGVAFGYLAHKLDKKFRNGALVKLAGRLRKQVYERNGDEREIFEIVLDPNGTKILKAAPDGDAYDFDDDTPKSKLSKIVRRIGQKIDEMPAPAAM
jgi:hypothetical protein